MRRYWYRDWRDGKEYVTDARNIQHLKKKAGTNRIEICKAWRKKNDKESELVLLY